MVARRTLSVAARQIRPAGTWSDEAMTDLTPLTAKNLGKRYDLPVVDWARAEEALAQGPTPDVTYFLGTCRPDGTPHAAGLGAQWSRGALYFTSNPSTRKARDLAVNPRCTMSVRLLTGYGEVLLAATWNYQGVYRSTDGGHRWERDSSGIPGIPADEFRGANAQATVGTSLYLAAPSGFAPPHPTGVYRSDDAGEHWTPVSDGLPHMAYGSTDSVVVGIEALYAKDGVLFAGCELGIWMLPRGATRWTPVTDDLQQCRVSAMVADDTYLYAALRDCGMWRRPLSTLAMGVGKDRPASPAPSAILGLDVTPNPVTSSARIRFALARPGHVTVSLHDGAGRLLETIADGAMEPGDHALLFDGRGLSSGTYFVRVESGGGSRTVELVYGK